MGGQKKALLRIVAAAAAFLAVTALTALCPMPKPWAFLLFAAVYGFIGWDVVAAAAGGIGRGQIFDEHFLMVLATVGAFATGLYPEAVAVMLLYQIGELFQRCAVKKSRDSISDLMELRPDTARVLTAEGEREVFPEEVQVGDTLVVRPGERVPLDGTVTEGRSLLDTSALTGEAVPRQCGPGDSILSGVIVTDGVVKLRVEKEFYDSTVSKILDMVENAAGRKARAETFITRFARYYTPIVAALALVMAVLPPLADGRWVHWIQNAMNFLVVSCPCALVISVPMSYFCGIGASSRQGVLVKGGSCLEQLARADVFVFDKTGTLTKGSFEVTGVYPEGRRQEILQAAAIAEQGSRHPIARSVLQCTGPGEDGWILTEQAGLGVTAQQGSAVILAGSRRHLEHHGVAVPEVSFAGTVVHVSRDGAYLGCIVISDELKQDALAALTALRQQGARTVMLTGDRREAAAFAAQKLGIRDFAAELLPADKVAWVEKLLEEKGKNSVLAFVGDGINDAPVLMRADLGIAMGAVGSDAAIEAADAVLMHDRLPAIAAARSIARKTMAIVRQNIAFALTVKLAVLALTPFGLVSVWLAIFADVGVAVLAILNAMRAGKH